MFFVGVENVHISAGCTSIIFFGMIHKDPQHTTGGAAGLGTPQLDHGTPSVQVQGTASRTQEPCKIFLAAEPETGWVVGGYDCLSRL